MTGSVVIGRNEGERLESCLRSIQRECLRIVYVDSGSSDGSVLLAKSMGVEALPFTSVTGDATKPVANAGTFDLVFADPPWELWDTRAEEIVATAVGAAAVGAHVRVILEAPGGFEVPVPLGWKLRKVIGKGKGQPAASILVRQAVE